jgi:NAD(P)H dehydrogenase (quinone)
MGSIAVVGVTGVIGSRVAGKLAAAGADVVGVSRSPGELEGMRTVAADLTDRAAAARALEGVDALYLTPPESGDDPLSLERAVAETVIDAAVERGVSHVVMHTAVHADRGDTGARILDNKTPLEKRLAASGLGYTILRPAWYLQNLFGAKPYLDQGMFGMPWPADMAWAATDVEDVAEAAVRFLDRGPANRGFDVHIPGGITAGAVCQAVESVTGRTVQYGEVPSSRAAVEGYPISETHKELYAELYDYFHATSYLGDPDRISEALPGFRPGGLEEFVGRELYARASV